MAVGPVTLSGVIQRTQDIGVIKQQEDSKPFVEQQNIQANHQAFQTGKPAADHRIVIIQVGAEGNAGGELLHDLIPSEGKHQTEDHDEHQPHFIVADIVDQVCKHQQRHAAVIKIQRCQKSRAQGDLHHTDADP